MNIKQCVVVRTDLQMSRGLLAAQVAHISAQFVAKTEGRFNNIQKIWLRQPYLYIYGVNCLEELNHYISLAHHQDLKYYLWVDTIPSKILKKDLLLPVGASFGPDDSDKLKRVLGDIPLL